MSPPNPAAAPWCASNSISAVSSAPLVGRLMVKKTKRFLKLEAQGLKARSEQLSRADGPHA